MKEILSGHNSFYLRDGWIKKGFEYIKENPKDDSFSKTKIEAIDKLGIGSVMVQSLKFWMSLLDILEKEGKNYILKRNIELIIEKDSYFQNYNTLWLLHIYIMERDREEEKIVLWEYFIRDKKYSAFTEKVALEQIKLYFKEKNIKVSERVIKDSLTVFIKTYYKEKKYNIDAEDNLYSPFTRLNYLQKKMNGEFYFRNIEAIEISEYILLYFMMRKLNKKNRTEINVSELYNHFNSVIRIKSLEFEKLLDRLENSEIISQDRSVGLQNIHVKKIIKEKEIIKKLLESEN